MKLVMTKRARQMDATTPSHAKSQSAPKKYMQTATSTAEGVHVFRRPEIPTYLQSSAGTYCMVVKKKTVFFYNLYLILQILLLFSNLNKV
jgi:hypothetical protein